MEEIMDKKVALIGASGFVGRAILAELLDRGFKVEAIVRNPEKLNDIDTPSLTVKKVDVADEKALEGALKGFETVISAYNPGWKNPNIAQETEKVYPGIVKAAKAAGVKRILIVGGAGSLNVKPGQMLMDTPGAIPNEILGAVKALGNFYLTNLKKEDGIDWVYFAPAAELKDGKRTGNYKMGGEDLIIGEDGKSQISVQDYAKAMVDEAENPQHHKARITIGYLFP